MTIESAAAGTPAPLDDQPSDFATTARPTCCAACAAVPSTCPATPGTTPARMPWNVAVDQRPAAVAYPANADEVSEVVPRRRGTPGCGSRRRAPATTPARSATARRRRAAPHLRDDPRRHRPRADGSPGSGRGALWLDVVEAAASTASRALHGSSPDVGVVGYSLGGGMGWYARELGLAANSVTAVELVLGDGTQLRATEQENRTCSGRSAAAAATSASSPRWSSSCSPIETAYAGMLHVGPAARREGAAGVGEVDRVRAGLRDHVVPAAEPAADARAAASSSAAVSSIVIDGAVLAEDAEAERIIADLRALEPGAGHVRPGAGVGAGPPAHGPRGTRRPASRPRRSWPTCPRRRSRRS